VDRDDPLHVARSKETTALWWLRARALNGAMLVFCLTGRRRMKLLKCLFIAIIFLAGDHAHAAGFRLLDIPIEGGQREIKSALWYPCDQPPTEVKAGPFKIMVARDCPLPTGRFPLVVISHGWGGTFLGHYDVAQTLADAGFIVAAINHGDSSTGGPRNEDFSVFIERPADIKRTIDFLLGAWPDAAKVDAERIGLFGFSRGGYTGLVVVGARPLFGRSPKVCEGKETSICQQARKGELPEPVHDARIKAAVIADPLSVFFTPQSFSAVRVPIQLWGSERGGDGVTLDSVMAISRQLPGPVEFLTVPGSQHFSFMPPCSAELAKLAPEICSDTTGFDRAAFHQEMNTRILAFFRDHLLDR
jgi:predicted dienelactone hydrolase